MNNDQARIVELLDRIVVAGPHESVGLAKQVQRLLNHQGRPADGDNGLATAPDPPPAQATRPAERTP